MQFFIMKSQVEIESKLAELEKYCIDEDFTTEEMQGEIQALKFTLDKLGEDL